MKPEGWIFLAMGWGITIALFVYCFSRILFQQGDNHANQRK